MNDTLLSALRMVDEAAPLMLQQVEHWASVNSGSANLDGLAAMGTLLAEAFAPLGGTLDLKEPTPADYVDTGGMRQPIPLGRNLHLVQRPDAPVRILLTGHMDTVFGKDHPFQTLRWLDDGTLNGPGVTDMKGGIAVMLCALKALEASPLASRIGYEVIINSDEEISSPGSAALLQQAAGRVHAALTYEPAQPDGMLVGARKGSGNFSIIVTGRAAHAGRNPQDGRNAMVAAADLAMRLKALDRPSLSVNPARIDGGAPNNMVPDLAIVRVNMRPDDAHARELAEHDLRKAIDAVSRDHGVAAHVHGSFTRPPKPLDAPALALFERVRACGRGLGLDIGWRPSGGVCDGNNLAAAGLPVVDTMGVRGGAIHSGEEFLIVESLRERARLSTALLLDIAENGLPGAQATT